MTTSDPDDGDIESITSPFDRADHANPQRSEPLAELLHAAASPDPARALAGEDAAVAAFRAARMNEQQRPSASRRHLITSCTTFTASLAALMATAITFAAATMSAPAHEPDFGPSSNRHATTEPPLQAASHPSGRPSLQSTTDLRGKP